MLDDDIARFDEFGIAVAALRHQVSGVSTELVDVELVVGEQYEVLKVAWAGGRVVRQAMQRIVDTLCSELRQRPRPAHRRFVCAVGDLVVGSVKVWNVEQVSDWPLDVLGGGAVDVGTFEKRKMQWDGRFRFRYNDRNAMVAHDQTKLLDEIGLEQVGLGDCGREVPGRWHMAIGLTRIYLRE